MNREDIIAMAREAGDDWEHTLPEDKAFLERFAQLVAQAERQKVANWMIQRSYATGHGDTVEDLLKELEWQVKEACANVNRDMAMHLEKEAQKSTEDEAISLRSSAWLLSVCEDEIRKRGQA